MSIILALMMAVAVQARTFKSPSMNREFASIVSSDTEVVPVVSFSKRSSLFGKSGSEISMVSGTNVVLFDCAGSDECSADVSLALGCANAVVCDVSYSDLLRGSAEVPDLQFAMERALAGGSGEKKALFVSCDCDCADKASVEAALRNLVAATWENAAKPYDGQGKDISAYFDVKVSALPSSKYNQAEYSTALGALRRAIASSKAVSTEDLSARLGAAMVPPLAAVTVAVDAAAFDACARAFEVALSDFAEGLGDLTAELGGAFDTFGDICDEALEQALGTFDALASEVEGTAEMKAKRDELRYAVMKQLKVVFEGQLEQLDELAWDRMRKGLVKLRLGDPKLMEEMEAAIADAEGFLKETAKRMLPRGAAWSAENLRRQTVAKMRDFVEERLQAARLQGTYVPGMMRRPVAVSLHYLATAPFAFMDSIQDSLSYEEDFDWVPDAKADVSRAVNSLPRGKLAQRAERG